MIDRKKIGLRRSKVVCRVSPSPMAFQAIFKGQIRHLLNEGFEAIIICSDGPEIQSVKDSEGCSILTIPFSRTISPKTDVITIYRLFRIFKQIRPDIVHTHTSKAGLLGMTAAFFAGIPIRIHSVPGLHLMESSGLMRFMLNSSERLTYSLATLVCPNSKSLKKYILTHKMCPSSKMRIIGHGSSNGIDIKRFNPNLAKSGIRETMRQKLNIDKDAFVLAYVGRIEKDKGINELIESFVSLYKSYRNLFLILIGKFDENGYCIYEETKKHIEEHPAIYITGWVSDVENYLSLSDIVVHPSFREGFSNSLLQAGAMGLPSISCDVVGCKDVVIDKKTGLLIPPKDSRGLSNAIEFLMEHPRLAKEMGISARRHIVKKYSSTRLWEKIVTQYNELLEARIK